jgi:fermentation-respiration switch protein FrsA (DUF1100 family)
LAVALAAAPAVAGDPISERWLFPNDRELLTPKERGLPYEEVEFPNAVKNKLHGWFLDSPRGDRTVLVCNGNTGNISYMVDYADFLFAAGYDVLLFDYQGFGKSAGQASVFHLFGDAMAAFDFLVQQKKRDPKQIGVFGVSLGSVLALALARHRQPAAVVVEDLYLPLENLKRAEAPVFFVHGERDRLLPPAGTLAALQAAAGPHRIWFMQGVGHAPESMEVNDREYRAQLAGFFDEVFSNGGIAQPKVELATEGEGAFQNAVAVTCSAPMAAQITLARADGTFTFFRRRLQRGRNELVLRTEFRPSHASVVAFHHTTPLEDGTWEPNLTPFSRSRAEFVEFGRRWRELVRGGPPAADELWERAWKLFPEAAEVHPRIRPRYTGVLAILSHHLREVRPEDSLAAARAALAFLPEDPRQHYELADASFVIGLRGFALAEALYRLGRHELEQGDVAAAKEHLRLYRHVAPRGREPRLTAEEIEALTRDSVLPR